MKRQPSLAREAVVPVVALIVLFVGLLCGCTNLQPKQPLDVTTAGPVILDALEWAEESISRDYELNDLERAAALRSVAIARKIITTAQGK